MNMLEVIKARHSVREYKNIEIPEELVKTIQNEIDICNQEGGLHIQLLTNEPQAFSTLLPHYGHFRGVENYIALIGENTQNIYEKIGYYGEKLVLYIQGLGLNSCWVGVSFSKNNVRKNCAINDNEKLYCVISIGYGTSQGISHKIKNIEEVYKSKEKQIPQWFINGVEYALLAPTAMNQQKFMFELKNKNEVAATASKGFFSKVDLGIVKYHFELGAGKENFKWV